MTGQQIYDLTTELLGGSAMSQTLFAEFLNMAKKDREGQIDWAVLRTENKDLVYTPDKAPITLPANFAKCIKQTARTNPVVFLQGNTKIGTAREILIDQKYDNQNDNAFYVEYGDDTATLNFTGGPDSTTPFALFYLKNTTDMNESNLKDWKWSPFPGDYAKLLAFDIANMVKGGIDYDDINARQVSFSVEDARTLERAMKLWDQRIKMSSRQV